MVDNTTNHGFQLFSDGEKNWEHRTDFKKLDWKVVLKDTAANRPAAGEQDRWFLATDEPNVYYDNGTSWDQVTNVSGAGHSVSDDGAEILSSPSDVNFAANLSVTDDGDGTVTVSGNSGGGASTSEIVAWTRRINV